MQTVRNFDDSTYQNNTDSQVEVILQPEDAVTVHSSNGRYTLKVGRNAGEGSVILDPGDRISFN